jgi:L-ascorbate metabolism protein UlaG (beta-lactamase superfamily)
MRLRPGRPDLASHRHRFTVPVADSDAPLTVTWLGVSTLLIDDGTSAVMTDGFFSRPSLARVGVGKVAPSPARVDGCLARVGVKRLEAVVPVHTHFDHALDSAANVGRGYGLSESRLVVTDGSPIRLGPFDITLIDSRHSPPDRFPGTIDRPVVTPVRAAAYRCGEAWATFVHHRPSDRRLLIQGSAGFVKGSLAGRQADVAYLGVGQLGVQPESYVRDYWAETVRTVGARRVVLVHWDDFFRPLSKPLRALPYVADDLDVSLRILSSLAERDGVALDMPTVWQREDPWALI